MIRPRFKVWDKNRHQMYDVQAIYYDEYGEPVRIEPLGSSSSATIGLQMKSEHSISAASSILLQSTGVMDVNGVEIFTGDLVKYCDEVYEVVNKGIIPELAIAGHGGDSDTWSLGGQGWLKLEVVGNIYQKN